MKDKVTRWLAEQIAHIDSVRTCAINRDADIVALTWSSNVTHIYLLEALPKARQIKKIVGDNTRVGIGTLFIIDANLIPPDGRKFIPDESLIALHALFKDKFYIYQLGTESQPQIGQVHFRSFGRGDEREIWYGPPIDIKHLPCYRVWVKMPQSVKGDWLIASFGSEGFWKAASYTAGRDAVRKQERNGSTHHFTWSKSSFGERRLEEEEEVKQAEPPPPSHKATRLESSYAQLGVDSGASHEEVKTAFRRLARELHPDVSQLPKDEAEHRFKVLSEAYTYIRVKKKW